MPNMYTAMATYIVQNKTYKVSSAVIMGWVCVWVGKWGGRRKKDRET